MESETKKLLSRIPDGIRDENIFYFNPQISILDKIGLD